MNYNLQLQLQQQLQVLQKDLLYRQRTTGKRQQKDLLYRKNPTKKTYCTGKRPQKKLLYGQMPQKIHTIQATTTRRLKQANDHKK